MQFHTGRKHMTDFLFPIALLFVFAASSFVVILLASNVYSHITASSEANYETGTSLSYITEKIRQNDTSGGVSIGSFDGCEALVLNQNYGDDSYVTYIYVDGKELKELFLQEGVEASASDGKSILSVESFDMEELSPGLFRFTCTSEAGTSSSICVSTKCKGGR